MDRAVETLAEDGMETAPRRGCARRRVDREEMLKLGGWCVAERILVKCYADGRHHLPTREDRHELLEDARRVEIAACGEQEQAQREDFEVIHNLAELILDGRGARRLAGVEEIGTRALDDPLEHGDRRGNLVASEGREKHAEPVGVELDGAIGT